jgi:hypothetical protein
MSQTTSNRRTHFRIEYPKSQRPTVVLAGGLFEVMDLSERGICFERSLSFRPMLNSTVSGRVQFKDGSFVDIEGRVVRIQTSPYVCALKLTREIPLAKVMDEQRRLRQRSAV